MTQEKTKVHKNLFYPTSMHSASPCGYTLSSVTSFCIKYELYCETSLNRLSCLIIGIFLTHLFSPVFCAPHSAETIHVS